MALESLKQCCGSLASEKVTDRKVGCDKLKSLLNNSTIISLLDRRSRTDSFSWDKVFLSTRKYFLAEARKLEDEERSKPNVSQTVLRNRGNQKHMAASLPHLILKKACHKTPHVTAHHVIEIVFRVLNKGNPYLLENFAAEFIQIVLKYILRFRQYYTEMKTENWQGLMKISVWLYNNNIPNVDVQSVVNIIEGIVQRCQTTQCSQQVPARLRVLQYLPPFLRQALLSEKLPSEFSLHSSLLRLLLTFNREMAVEWRQLLCQLGEETFDSVLAMWDDRPSNKQTHWLEYFTLQLTMHHPQKDGEFSDDSEYSGDKARWQRCLHHLYQLLHDHLARRAPRGISGPSQLLSQPLLTLATRLCLQIFGNTESRGFIDVTQVASSSTGSEEPGGKRRKIAVGLLPLTDLLKGEGMHSHTIPWYQILLELLTHHSSFFNEGRCVLVLDTLKEVLASCGDPVLQEHVIRCLEALALQYSKFCCTAKRNECMELWTPVWDVTLRLVSGRQCSSPGLDLLGTLVSESLVVPESSAFELFHQNYIDTCESALWTLLATLTVIPLPRLFENEPAWLHGNQIKEARKTLIQYALPMYRNGQETSGKVPAVECLRNPGLLSQVLVTLCEREPMSSEVSLRQFKRGHYMSKNTTEHLRQIEEVYRLSTFSCHLPSTFLKTPSSHNLTYSKEGKREWHFLQDEKEFMIRRVMDFIKQLEDEDMLSSKECLHTLLHLAELLVQLFIITCDQRLERKFQQLMSLVTSALEELSAELESSQWHAMLSPLQCLLQLYRSVETKRTNAQTSLKLLNETDKERRRHILSFIPSGLFALVVRLLKQRCEKTKLTKGSSVDQGSFDEFDFEFEASVPSTSDAFKDEIMDFDSDSSIQMEEEYSEETITLDDPTTFTLRDQCVMVAGQWLVEAIIGQDDGTGPAHGVKENYLLCAVDVVLQLSNSPSLELADIGVVFSFVRSVFVAEYSEENILDGLTLISNVGKQYSAQAQVATCALLNLAELIRCHGTVISPDIKSNILKLTKAFVIKQQQGKYGHSVSQAIFTVNAALSKVDPSRIWSSYEIPQYDRCGKMYDLLSHSSHELRVRTACSIHLLLKHAGNGREMETNHQDCVFKEVYQIILEGLTVKDLPSEDLSPDEKGNRVSTFLLTLGTVAVTSPYLQGKVMFALCLSVPEYKVEPSLLLRLLSCITSSIGSSPHALLALHLPYLATQWIQHRYDIRHFPSKAFGYDDTKTFLSENRNALLPIFLECDEQQALDVLAESCDKEVREMFVEAFALIMAHVFPCIAAEHTDEIATRMPEVKIQCAKRQYKFIERTLGTDTFTALMSNHIGDMALHLLRLVHETQPLVEEEVVVVPGPPFFIPEVIMNTFHFIGGIFRQDGLLFVFLAKRKEIHKVFLGELQQLARSSTTHTARRSLTSIATLMRTVLPHLGGHMREVSPYIVRMLMHTLTGYIDHLCQISAHLAEYCTTLLQQVIIAVLEKQPTHLVPAIPNLFVRMLSQVMKGSWVEQCSIRTLQLVLNSDHQDVRTALANLSPLPVDLLHEGLTSLREQHLQLVVACRGDCLLQDEVDNFLSVPLELVAVHYIAHMTTMIQKNREQMAHLFKSACSQESKGHRLIHRLVALASQGEECVSLEACRCLGEVGLVSLGTPVFWLQDGSYNHNYIHHDGEIDIGFVCKILTMLNTYLTCENIQVVETASSSLINVLRTREGHDGFQQLELSIKEELTLLLSDTKPRLKSSSSLGVDAASYLHIVGEQDMWLYGESYESWVKVLATTLITAGCGSDLVAQALPMCTVKPEFSAFLLPFIIHSALRTDNGSRRDVLSRQFSKFFQRHSEANNTATTTSPTTNNNMVLNKAALQVLLGVVDYLRTKKPQRSFLGRKTVVPFECNLWLHVNYLHIARAAHYHGAHFSALFYLQLHHEQMLQEIQEEKSKEAITRRLQATPLARVSGHPDADACNRLMLQIYGSLGDSDGVEGCVAGSKNMDFSTRMLRYQYRGEWLEAVAACDATQHTPGIIQGLSALGLFNTLGTLLGNGALSHPSQFSEDHWKTAWRLCRWDTEENRSIGGVIGVMFDESRFNQHLFHALQALHYQDLTSLQEHILHARRAITRKLRLSRPESSSSVYPLLSHLQILCEVEAASSCLNDLTYPEKVQHCVAQLEDLWDTKECARTTEFEHKEQVLAARVSTLNALTSLCKGGTVERILHKVLLDKSKLSRENNKSGRVLGSEAAILSAAQLDVSKQLLWLTQLEEAQVAKVVGDMQRARHTLQELIADMEKHELERGQERVLSQALTLLGGFLMDARALTPNTIIKEYFHRATSSLLHHASDDESRSVLENSYQQLAQYVDQLYRQVHHHLESDVVQAKRENITRTQEELTRLRNLLEDTPESHPEWTELKRNNILLQRNLNIDRSFLSELEKKEQEYLNVAMMNYLNCLAITSKHDHNIYRVVGLWMQNSHKREINRMISKYDGKVKRYHFVPLLYQLVARLSCNRSQEDSFPEVLFDLLVHVCLEHPHHSLPVVYALAHAHANHQLKQGPREEIEVNEEDRVQAAKVLVENLKKTELKDHMLEFERVSLAYLSLANWGSTLGRPNSGDKVTFPRTEPLSTLRGLNYTAALTVPIKLQASGHYRPTLIQDWEKTGIFVGGINAPIRLTLRTSDGMKHFELLKGKDDVRQDAVMEQVFCVVNELLGHNNETCDRALSVRTYQVVPLSQRSGLIQWCKNTQAFGRYLIGGDKKSGAHKTYYPKDYSAKTCCDKMKAVRAKSAEERFEVFQNILENFHPVFHHFFLENYSSPHEWYKRRLAYTKSVATNSMVGYILGLGDRHVENILLDKKTAELIHIDLGIAFELGKVLPTPETVPFRMTQDMVDGLGVLGVEGPLRCCCEATLRVLRVSSEVLVTLVEVLRHDPLHQWTLTPQQAARLQATGAEEEHLGCSSSVSMAERVVLRVQQKLAGMEEGYPCNVADQVSRLLQDATDPANLSKLFGGWQPYL